MHEGIRVVLLKIVDEVNKLKSQSTVSGSADQASHGINNSGTGLDSFWSLLGLVILLIIILAATYYTTKFIGGIKQNQFKKGNFQVIDAYRISQNKVVQIVKIGNKYVVLGIGKDTINYITELDEAEVFIREINAGEKMSFNQILEKLKNNKKQ